jgi:drug/metabolite transporter (DMT)-like permease
MGGGAFVIPWKRAAEHGSVSSMVLVMLLTAAVLSSLAMLSPALRRPPPEPGSRRLLAGMSAAFAVLTLVGNSASAAAIGVLSAPLVSVLLRTDVILVAALGWVLLGERVTGRFWLGAGLAVVGLWVAQSPGATGAADPVGLLLALLAALSFSAMGILTRRYIRQVDPIALNATRLWMSVGLWFATEGLHLPDDLTPQVIGYAALAALIGPGIARICLMLSARDLEARMTAMVGITGPLWAVVFAWVFLGTLPQQGQLIGGGIIFIGVALPVIQRGSRSTGGR